MACDHPLLISTWSRTWACGIWHSIYRLWNAFVLYLGRPSRQLTMQVMMMTMMMMMMTMTTTMICNNCRIVKRVQQDGFWLLVLVAFGCWVQSPMNFVVAQQWTEELDRATSDNCYEATGREIAGTARAEQSRSLGQEASKLFVCYLSLASCCCCWWFVVVPCCSHA